MNKQLIFISVLITWCLLLIIYNHFNVFYRYAKNHLYMYTRCLYILWLKFHFYSTEQILSEATGIQCIRPSIFVVVDLVWFVCFPSLMLGSIRVFSCKHFQKLQHLNLAMWCYREPSRSTLFLCSLLSSFTWCITKLSVNLVKFGYASDDWEYYSEWQKCLLSHCISVYLWIISGEKRKKKL